MNQVVSLPFEGVHGQFLRIAESRADTPLALAVYVDGELVLDVWAGPDDPGTTLRPVFSSTKGIGGAIVGMLVQRNLLSLDEKVATYWPEFAAAGKSELDVRTLLSHQAGLVGVDGGFAIADVLEHEALAQRLADQTPYWVPGTQHGYHALTIGVLIRELLSRVDGRTPKQFYEDEIRAGSGFDFTIGCPRSERARLRPQRMAFEPSDLVPPPAPGSLLELAFGRGLPNVAAAPDPAVLDGDMMSAGGFGNARGLAAFYATIATGLSDRPPLLDRETIDAVRTELATGTDAVLPVPTAFGVVFQVPGPIIDMAGPGSFGHDGAAGSLGFANPDLGLAFGWVNGTSIGMGADPDGLTLAHEIGQLLRGEQGGERDARALAEESS